MTAWPILAALSFAGVVLFALHHIIDQSRQYRRLALGAPRVEEASTVAVIVPARNEGGNIGPCLRRLARQIYPPDKLKIIAVDDESHDATVAEISAVAQDTGRIALIEAGPLPAGWAGKPHACWRGAQAAGGEWLCFIDADTQAEPLLLQSAVAAARSAGADMISLEPFQELTGFLDRLVMPLGFLVLAATQSLDRLAVNGQFILIKADIYFRIGGHAASPAAVCEDLALARAVAEAGGRVAVLGAENLIRTRMYRDAATLWEGLSKNLTEIYGGVGRTLAIAALVLLAGWCTVLLPLRAVMDFVDHAGAPAFVELLLTVPIALIVIGVQMALARHFRVPLGYGLLFPLSATVGAALALNAVRWKLLGRVVWKGRIYSN